MKAVYDVDLWEWTCIRSFKTHQHLCDDVEAAFIWIKSIRQLTTLAHLRIRTVRFYVTPECHLGASESVLPRRRSSLAKSYREASQPLRELRKDSGFGALNRDRADQARTSLRAGPSFDKTDYRRRPQSARRALVISSVIRCRPFLRKPTSRVRQDRNVRLRK